MAKKVYIEDVAKAINEALEEYRDVSMSVLEEGVNKASKEAVRELHQSSPKRSGAYARGWAVKKEKQDRYWTYKKIVYNEKHYRLTHLLEKGHRVIGAKNGRTWVDARPHIEKVEKKAVESFERYVKEHI